MEITFPQAPFLSKTNNKQEEKIIAKTNRIRPCNYSFRLSEKEKEYLQNQLNKSGLSLTNYLLKLMLDKPILNISNGNEILMELKKQGNNLNQAVKNNYFGKTTEYELQNTLKQCKLLYSKISNLLTGTNATI